MNFQETHILLLNYSLLCIKAFSLQKTVQLDMFSSFNMASHSYNKKDNVTRTDDHYLRGCQYVVCVNINPLFFAYREAIIMMSTSRTLPRYLGIVFDTGDHLFLFKLYRLVTLETKYNRIIKFNFTFN